MRTLIIEDDPLKAERLNDHLRDHSLINELSTKTSYQSGLKATINWLPELIILDMTLPTFDPQPGNRAGRPRHFGGMDILRNIKRRGINTAVIVVTQLRTFGEGDQLTTLDEMTCQCLDRFPDVFMGSVFYIGSQDDWKQTLDILLIKAGDAK